MGRIGRRIAMGMRDWIEFGGLGSNLFVTMLPSPFMQRYLTAGGRLKVCGGSSSVFFIMANFYLIFFLLLFF